MSRVKSTLRKVAPWPLLYAYLKLRDLPQDLPQIARLLFQATKTPTRFVQRIRLVWQCYRISYLVECAHKENEMIEVMRAIFALDPSVRGVVVEAGSYKGGSGVKLSLAARLANRTLYLFDSFEGIPRHAEVHIMNIHGSEALFPPGSYQGSLQEVRHAITAYGAIETCKFVKGWFQDTMPHFKEPVAVAYIDVDLRSSTSTCMQYLYPRLIEDGVLFSQDGHLPLVIDLLQDDSFWNNTVKSPVPTMRGLGRRKLVEIRKPTQERGRESAACVN
jgi:O-methyltransferase